MLKWRKSLKRQHAVFLIAGLMGFATEASIIRLGIEILDAHPVILRAISFPIAVLVTWIINRHFGFRVTAPVSFGEFVRYFNSNVIAQSANFIIFTLLTYSLSHFKKWPELALLLATTVSMLISFKLYSAHVFGNRK